jgi:selenocysteine-specific elongation factor
MRGDRLILRQVAPPDTIGGGTIIDPAARRHSGSEEVIERLTRIERGEDPASQSAPSTLGASQSALSTSGASQSALSTSGDPVAAALLELLRADGERPRADGELLAAAGVGPAAAAAAFRLLEQSGDAPRIARNLHIAREPLEALCSRVIGICERDGLATIASVRDELGTSRKYAQGILEYLDATKVTLRRDDAHVLRRR